jgi:hypothetical protein
MLHATYSSYPTRKNITLIPFWSPELAFMFEEKKPLPEIYMELHKKGIDYIICQPYSLGNYYYEKIPFFYRYIKKSVGITTKNCPWVMFKLSRPVEVPAKVDSRQQ